MIALLIIICLLLTALLAVSFIYLWRFSKIILVIEDDFSEAVEALQESEDLITECLEQPMFFDSPDLQRRTIEALDGVKASRIVIAKLIDRFTQLSKQKYIVIETE